MEDDDTTLEALARRAAGGDREALGALLRAVQGPVYRLCLRMLWHPQDAEDAAQEILVRVATHLGGFEARSKLLTWVHRIAVRHLLAVRQGRKEKAALQAGEFTALIDLRLRMAPGEVTEAETRLVAKEVRVGCVNGMLLCLSRQGRAAYLLAEVLGVEDEEAAEICQVPPATYRQRLSRARRTMDRILRDRCGLVSEANPCRCDHQARVKLTLAPSDAQRLIFARRLSDARSARAVGELRLVARSAPLFHDEPLPAPPATLWDRLCEACPELCG
jgi:RNA polymerase sigma factor (sigma-70 family)